MSDAADTVDLHRLALTAVVGILPDERVTPQLVELDVRIRIPLDPIAERGDLSLGIDYAAIARELAALVEEGRFWLIESLALAACRWILLPPLPQMGRGAATGVRVAVRKPEILGGVAVPGVTLERAAPVTAPRHESGGVSVDVLVCAPRDGAWRVVLAPGATWAPGSEQGGLVVAGSARSDGISLPAGARFGRESGPIAADRDGAVLLVAGTPVTDRPGGA